MMMRFFLAIALVFSFHYNYCQSPIDSQYNRSCIVGVWPSQITNVNGLMLNFWSKETTAAQLTEGKPKLPTTNGLEINLNPIGPFAAVMTMFHFPFEKEFRNPSKDSINYLNISNYKKINGIQLALLNMEPTKMNGIEFHLVGSIESVVNGLSISVLLSKKDKLNGLGIGVLGNFDTEVNGVQIGLINKTHKLKGIQIGLWNTNEKRSLPFINWNF